MTGRIRFLISLCIILAVFTAFIAIQSFRLYTDTAKKSTVNLIDQYYQLKDKNPDAAKRALELILQQDPHHHLAMRELGFWFLRQGDTRSALQQFQLAHQQFPDDIKITAQLEQLQTLLGIKNTAMVNNAAPATPLHLQYVSWNQPVYLGFSAVLQDALLKQSDLRADLQIPLQASSDSNARYVANHTADNAKAASTVSLRDQLLNEFYMSKNSNNITAAWAAIKKLVLLYPDDLIGLKEAGYFALSHHENLLAIEYFDHAYIISHDAYLALQIGYIYNSLNQNRKAYHYFSLATDATDLNERMKAELAMTNLRGSQTRFLPDRFYANVMFYPFYRSRFKLLIYPVIARVGYVFSQTYQASFYVIYRRTSDNKSTGSGLLPQIYEDNAAITAVGIQAAPFKSFPLNGFIEAGKAVDLVYKNRGRWRNDFRTGLTYYNEWGKEARYTFTPQFTLKPNMDLYADAIYFSRYLNTIATMRARPGIEVLRYGSASINLYYKVFVSEDESRIFYNNILEVGPSVAFTPSDRYFFTIRYECLRGFYLPSSGSSENPFSSVYHNNMIFLDMFAGL